MKTFAMIALFMGGLGGSALAAPAPTTTTTAASDQQAAEPAPVKHYDFDDDQVVGDLQRPDGEMIVSMQQAKESSLIELRKSFLPELIMSFENM